MCCALVSTPGLSEDSCVGQGTSGARVVPSPVIVIARHVVGKMFAK